MKRTTKILKTHYSCVCGLNVVEQEEVTMSYRYLAKLGAKRRKFKDGTKFWFLETKNEVCEFNHYE